jgi:acetyl-CoA acyltransferase
MPKEAYIVDCLRTAVAIGKPTGSFSATTHPVDLLAAVLRPLAARNNAKDLIEDVITGVVTPIGKQGANVGRLAAVKALGHKVPGIQINRMCGSGQQAVHFASQAVAAGDMDVVVGCGVELMGSTTMGRYATDYLSFKPLCIEIFLCVHPNHTRTRTRTYTHTIHTHTHSHNIY